MKIFQEQCLIENLKDFCEYNNENLRKYSEAVGRNPPWLLNNRSSLKL